ncbi:IS6 family transposase [Legionella rowbothamii]|uniref:IS6 family transposase n=1 Tax=Legionella rowbothamii TaxID=96229 RepID=UPI001055C7F9|nr:IS6 family transposase [Legionella rowbothamii]
MLERKPKGCRYPIELISIAVWSYYRFNDSYRDVSERLLDRGIDVSYKTNGNGTLNWVLILRA